MPKKLYTECRERALITFKKVIYGRVKADQKMKKSGSFKPQEMEEEVPRKYNVDQSWRSKYKGIQEMTELEYGKSGKKRTYHERTTSVAQAFGFSTQGVS